MQSLRDQLLKAGLVSEDQVKKLDAQKQDRRGGRNGRKRNDGRRDGPRGEAPANGGAPASPSPAKLSKKAIQKLPIPRMIDMSDPKRLEIFQAIEAHRVRGEVKGDVVFHFTLRDGRIRKLFVSTEVFKGLEEGRFAIVENGEPEKHLIVTSEAVLTIRGVDQEAVRFFNAA